MAHGACSTCGCAFEECECTQWGWKDDPKKVALYRDRCREYLQPKDHGLGHSYQPIRTLPPA